MNGLIKLGLVTVLISSSCILARADYESQCWTFGQYPHRWGIVGINDEWTRISFGQEFQVSETDGSWRYIELHLHPHTFLAMVNLPVFAGVLAFFLRRRYRRRHARLNHALR